MIGCSLPLGTISTERLGLTKNVRISWGWAEEDYSQKSKLEQEQKRAELYSKFVEHHKSNNNKEVPIINHCLTNEQCEPLHYFFSVPEEVTEENPRANFFYVIFDFPKPRWFFFPRNQLQEKNFQLKFKIEDSNATLSNN